MLSIWLIIAHLKFELDEAFQRILRDLSALGYQSKNSFSSIPDLDKGLIVVFFKQCELFEYKAKGSFLCLLKQVCNDCQIREVFDSLEPGKPLLAESVM